MPDAAAPPPNPDVDELLRRRDIDLTTSARRADPEAMLRWRRDLELYAHQALVASP